MSPAETLQVLANQMPLSRTEHFHSHSPVRQEKGSAGTFSEDADSLLLPEGFPTYFTR